MFGLEDERLVHDVLMQRGDGLPVVLVQQVEEVVGDLAVVHGVDAQVVGVVEVPPLVYHRGNHSDQFRTEILFYCDHVFAVVLGGILRLSLERHSCAQNIHGVRVFGHDFQEFTHAFTQRPS